MTNNFHNGPFPLAPLLYYLSLFFPFLPLDISLSVSLVFFLFHLASGFCDHAITSTTLRPFLQPSCYTWPDRFRQFYIHVRARLIYYVWRSLLSFLFPFALLFLPSPATRWRELRIFSGELGYSKSSIVQSITVTFFYTQDQLERDCHPGNLEEVCWI